MQKSLRSLLRLLVSAALLGFILPGIPFDQLASILRETDPWPILAALALTPCMIWLTATQTRVLTDLQGLTLTTGQIFAVTFATAFHGLMLPGALVGGAIRWYKFSEQDNKPAQALAAIAFGRLLNTLVAAAIGLACWTLDDLARRSPLNGILLGVILAGLLVSYALFFRRRTSEAMASFLERRAIIPAFARAKQAKLLRAAADFQALPVPVVLKMTVVFALYHLLGIVAFWLLARALSMEIAFSAVGWTRTYVLLIMALPISFLGLGVREGALILMLQAYGISAPAAVAYSFLILARTLFTALIGGAIELVQFLRPAKVMVRP
ncbi:MAG: lysylphosphatidylglycerol synthase transmembrane domain-containing protein [Steroidobacteraceae bacterium]